MVWLGIQVAELIVSLALLRVLVPDSWSRGAQSVVLIVVVIGITWANYVVRRRFIGR